MSRHAAPAVKDMPLYAVRALTKPSCEDADCDPAENPDHWVSIRLSAEALTVFARVADALDRSHGSADARADCDYCAATRDARELLARLGADA